MPNRSIVVAAVAFVLGLLVGSTLAPASLWPRSSVERENAALRQEVKSYKEEVRLYKQMIEAYKAEQAEIKDVLKGK